MPWTKVQRPRPHTCGLPRAMVIDQTVGDEWTCERCGQVWVVRARQHVAGGKRLEEKDDQRNED